MPGEGIESQIKQIEKYIEEKGKRYLSEEEYNQYSKHKEQFKQRQNEQKCKKKYYKTLKEYKLSIEVRNNDQSVDKVKKNLVKINQEVKKIDDTILVMNQSIKTGQEMEHRCLNLLKNQNTKNKMLFLFFICAAVFIAALVCYAIFSNPSYVLDNVTVRESMKGISL